MSEGCGWASEGAVGPTCASFDSRAWFLDFLAADS